MQPDFAAADCRRLRSELGVTVVLMCVPFWISCFAGCRKGHWDTKAPGCNQYSLPGAALCPGGMIPFSCTLFGELIALRRGWELRQARWLPLIRRIAHAAGDVFSIGRRKSRGNTIVGRVASIHFDCVWNDGGCRLTIRTSRHTSPELGAGRNGHNAGWCEPGIPLRVPDLRSCLLQIEQPSTCLCECFESVPNRRIWRSIRKNGPVQIPCEYPWRLCPRSAGRLSPESGYDPFGGWWCGGKLEEVDGRRVFAVSRLDVV